MKTKFFYGLLLASAACLSVCSCNDNEPKAVTENPVDAFEELNANLQDYNAEFEMRHPQTRRNFFRKLDDFVKADFGGVSAYQPDSKVDGGKIGSTATFSISASVDSWTEGFIVPVEDLVLDDESRSALELLYDTSFSQYENLGYYHNRVICELFEEKPEVFSDKETFVTAVVEKLNEIGVETPTSEINNICSQLDSYKTNILNESNDVMFDNIIALKPEKADEINIMRSYFNNVTKYTTAAEIKEYSQNVKNIIAQSAVSAEAKTEMIANVSVGEASSLLWGYNEGLILDKKK